MEIRQTRVNSDVVILGNLVQEAPIKPCVSRGSYCRGGASIEWESSQTVCEDYEEAP
jgi:hypothetical protein